MPISKSAKKALRVTRRKTALNKRRRVLLRQAIKSVSKESLPQAISLIDKAVKWHLIHKNKAARLKSALAKKLPATPGVGKGPQESKPKRQPVAKALKRQARPKTTKTK